MGIFTIFFAAFVHNFPTSFPSAACLLPAPVIQRERGEEEEREGGGERSTII